MYTLVFSLQPCLGLNRLSLRIMHWRIQLCPLAPLDDLNSLPQQPGLCCISLGLLPAAFLAVASFPPDITFFKKHFCFLRLIWWTETFGKTNMIMKMYTTKLHTKNFSLFLICSKQKNLKRIEDKITLHIVG